MIAETASPRDISAQAKEEGVIDLRQAALVKVARGVTSFDEMHRIVPSEEIVP